MAKTNTSKNKNPATAGRRKKAPTLIEQIQLSQQVFSNNVANHIDRLILDMSQKLAPIQADLSLLKSGSSFMQELDRVAKEEQGLEDGDYTDASKQVADALTAMGYDWYDADRDRLQYITWGKQEAHLGLMVNMHGKRDDYTHRTNADFLSRARVEAKKLGLVPLEEPKEEWKVGARVKKMLNRKQPEEQKPWRS